MTTDEMVSIIEDVIDVNIETAPDDLPEEEIGEWIDREGWRIYHVHGDDPEVVNVFANGHWLFECSRVQFLEVMRRLSEDVE